MKRLTGLFMVKDYCQCYGRNVYSNHILQHLKKGDYIKLQNKKYKEKIKNNNMKPLFLNFNKNK